ncbi:MAG: type II toxin-antitoxin system VapC family toxin [Vicinamibacteria bacterium]
MRLYLDANAIVFAVEGPDRLRDFVAAWTERAESSPEGAVLTSRLSLSECLILPIRRKDEAAIEKLQRFFAGSVQVLSVDDELVDMATDLHREYSLKTIDALHLATAIRGKADVFLTRDAGIARYPRIRSVTCEQIPRE